MTTEAVAATRRPSASRFWPVAADVVLVLILLLVGPHRFLARPDRAPELALLLVLVVPLLWRRRAPMLVFGLIAAAAFVQWWTLPPAVADAALLIAFYSVAVTCSLRRTVLAAVVLEGGVALAVARYAPANGGHALGFVFLSGLVTAAGVLGANVRVRRAYLHEVEQRAARLEVERDQQAQLAVAAERARVAREMHDIVAHNVSVMVALTDGAALTLRADPARAGTALAEASRAGRSALTDMRRVLGLLRDSGDPAALAPAPDLAALDDLLDAVRHTSLDVRYETSGALDAVERGTQLSAFRIVQEAITNTIRHADGATFVDVRLHATPAGLEVLVGDDGRPTGAAATGSGHGIVGMRERAAVHAGDVQTGRTATGWLVRAWLPATVAEPAELVRTSA